MKKILKYIAALVPVVGIFTACHKVDVEVTTELTPANYPITDAQFTSAMGPVYIALRSEWATTNFFLQSMSTDESLLAIYNTDWVDGNRYLEMHRHTWTKDNPIVNSGWTYWSNLVGTANQTIYILRKAVDGPLKSSGLAEMQAIRALAYFELMDMYGNVPIDTLYPTTELHEKTPRAQVFSFIESELKTAIPNLKTASGTATYGKPNRYMAYALLAKMYLNAVEYTGTQRYNDCIAACDSVINAGGGTQYGIEPMTTYLQMFYPANGSGQKEFVFALPFDPSTSGGYLFYGRYDLNRNLGIKYKYSGSTAGTNLYPIMNSTSGGGLLNNKPSGPRMTTSEFYAYYNDPNDVRNGQWLTGKQYWDDAKTQPIKVLTSNIGYDQFYSGGSPTAAYTYDLELFPLTTSRLGATSYDLGKDEIAWNIGYRNIKFYPDGNSISRNQSNDAPVFRFSDIILMKAEAILRGGTATMGHTALSLFNMVKGARTTTTLPASITLDDLYAERTREFSWELWHRNDMIRFGKYEGSWGLSKTNADTYRRLFPIPTIAFTTNNKLTQNTGY